MRLMLLILKPITSSLFRKSRPANLMLCIQALWAAGSLNNRICVFHIHMILFFLLNNGILSAGHKLRFKKMISDPMLRFTLQEVDLKAQVLMMHI
ncbi:hypothetical protein H206_05301 [Candidatus Electrothrix aarhusensis]|uniref:Uncharacterized protein n=1 Tax=Candidatus Electrothrix aarhusensis TaxID=1859131 RepID=A0A444J4V5_9BACT|nr:hypothetical protein H206_05301 [Candidatus Electrothrix aarhusensis]